MLDFYWVRDGEKLTAKLASERYLGGLEFAEFAALEHVWPVLRRNGVRIEFMEDSRLSASDVITALRITAKLAANDSLGPERYLPLKAALRAAKEKGAGMMAVTD